MSGLILTATFAFVSGMACCAMLMRRPTLPRRDSRNTPPPFTAVGRRKTDAPLADSTLTRFAEPGGGR